MLDLTGYGRFAQLSKLTDRMIDDASKEAVATAARVLAIQIGHYQRKFGVIPMDEAVDLLESKGLSEDEAGWVADGLESLAVVLASIKDEEPSPSVNQPWSVQIVSIYLVHCAGLSRFRCLSYSLMIFNDAGDKSTYRKHVSELSFAAINKKRYGHSILEVDFYFLRNRFLSRNNVT